MFIFVQKIISNVLGIPINRINMKVKRVGGGFGGKESRSMLVAVPVAFAAHKLQTPVRCMLDRDEDMMLTGNRHPFYFKYKLGVKNNGKILGAKFELYCNGGCTLDLSPAVSIHYNIQYLLCASLFLSFMIKKSYI